MTEEYYYFDDDINPPKFWLLQPKKKNTYSVEIWDFGELRDIEIKQFSSEDYLQRAEQIEKEVSEIKQKGYRRLSYQEYIHEEDFTVLKKLENKLKRAKQVYKTWVPITENQEGTIYNSKFLGKAYLNKNEDYPRCGFCNEPLQILLQLNLEEIPKEKNIFGKGIIQLFYCFNLEKNCYLSDLDYNGRINRNNIFENPANQLLRYLPYFEKLNLESYQLKINELKDKLLPEKIIKYWKYAGIEYTYFAYKFADRKTSPVYIKKGSEEYYLIDDNIDRIIRGEKIGGFPLYIQSEGIYEQCPDCGKILQELIQIGSNVNIPFMFGDGGVAHILLCPEHKNNLLFTWDCS